MLAAMPAQGQALDTSNYSMGLSIQQLQRDRFFEG
jgi:hypothetical protein